MEALLVCLRVFTFSLELTPVFLVATEARWMRDVALQARVRVLCHITRLTQPDNNGPQRVGLT